MKWYLRLVFWLVVLFCPIWVTVAASVYGPTVIALGSIFRVGFNQSSSGPVPDASFLGFDLLHGQFEFPPIMIVFIIPSIIANFILDGVKPGGPSDSRIKWLIWVSPVLLAVLSTIQTILTLVFGSAFAVVLPSYLIVGLLHWIRVNKMQPA